MTVAHTIKGTIGHFSDFIEGFKLGAGGTCILRVMCAEKGGIGKDADMIQLVRHLHGDDDGRSAAS